MRLNGTNLKPESPYLSARARRETARAALAEIELKERSGDILEAAAVEEAWSAIVVRIRAKFLALPTRMAPLLTDEPEAHVIKTKLENAVHGVLNELANSDPGAILRQKLKRRSHRGG